MSLPHIEVSAATGGLLSKVLSLICAQSPELTRKLEEAKGAGISIWTILLALAPILLQVATAIFSGKAVDFAAIAQQLIAILSGLIPAKHAEQAVS